MCARAVVKAAREAWPTASPDLFRSRPKTLAGRTGAASGEDRDGVFFANNSCPSQGTMDIFVEPVLPSPRLLIIGASPVAVALANTRAFDGLPVDRRRRAG